MKRIDWEDQRAFLAVLEEGSLSAAARRLGVTQPTMRARLEALESALGTVLFTRSVRGLVPTEQALSLGAAARAMARASEAFVRAASAPPDRVAGRVRISVPQFIGQEVLPSMVAELRRRHPDLILEIELSDAVANILEQEADVAVRMQQPSQGALIARKVPPIELGFFAHVDYLARRGRPDTVADLDDHDLIGPDRHRYDLAMLDAHGSDIPLERFVARVDSHPAQLALIRAGVGIGVTQCGVGRRDQSLRQVLPEVGLPPLETWIVTHEDLRSLPRIAAVFDYLVGIFDRLATT